MTELMVKAFAFVVPELLTINSPLAAETNIFVPEIVEAPPALSCKTPPIAVALVEVIVSAPPLRLRLLPPVMRIVLAASAAVVVTAALTM